MKLDDLPIADQVRSIADRTKNAVQCTDDYVHENPWMAVGAAVLAGVVLGLLVGPRNR